VLASGWLALHRRQRTRSARRSALVRERELIACSC
jgi:hypothetical protein